MKLPKRKIDNLLRQVEDPELRKQLESLFRQFLNPPPKNPMPIGGSIKKRSAKKALDIISRIGIEISKHKAIDWFFELFD